MGVSIRHAIAGGVAAAAIAIGAAAPAGAATDPLAAVAAVAAGAAVGDIAAPQGMTTQALIAAYNAGLPIYEAIETREYTGPKRSFSLTEYQRVHDIDSLNSPTAKFVTFGAAAPDHFWVLPGTLGGTININLRWYRQENVGFPMVEFEPTPQKFTNSPLVQLPDGSPSVGVALVTPPLS
ncbi:hypothetical protein [Prescottella agglutinans]|uniref:Uncharacterized protein n=1 Tax=Prescottella agglutinans TaxID=1644129 RepID=A0ABT6ME20_9NOCA|nr:hypothetical protein [Prescottella agglutinans]MDH6282568.1 hypothetical protein [Prescottella agglutinans]